MATAALDAMHFANYASFPHHPLKYNPATSQPPAAQQPQPIYHNQIILQQQAAQQQQAAAAAAAAALYSNYAGQTHQTTVEIHKTQHDNKSNSSLESIDQIPFANENAGTIKQRSMNRMVDHPTLHERPPTAATMLSHSSSSTSSSSSTGSITTTLAGCIQQLSPPQESAGGTGSATNCSNSASGPGSCSTSPTQATQAAAVVGTNVLNDIGNMLANLTDELDAMLEEENRAGISDIE